MDKKLCTQTNTDTNSLLEQLLKMGFCCFCFQVEFLGKQLQTSIQGM